MCGVTINKLLKLKLKSGFQIDEKEVSQIKTNLRQEEEQAYLVSSIYYKTCFKIDTW